MSKASRGPIVCGEVVDHVVDAEFGGEVQFYPWKLGGRGGGLIGVPL